MKLIEAILTFFVGNEVENWVYQDLYFTIVSLREQTYNPN